jgi:hypothetical protein
LIRSVFIADYRSPTANVPLKVQEQKIVFVLHGIRASNLGWVDETAEIIMAKYPDAIVCKPTFGFFSALHFFLPWVRRTKARWFQDRYSELAAKFPYASFYFIGHSYATYMLGRSLAKVSMIRFVNAYMAGSVLPATYDWTARFNKRQLQALRSDASARDVPVGLLCSALSFMRDIGTGGYSGFQGAPNSVREEKYYYGGHSKPLEDRRNLELIVDEVMSGTAKRPIDYIGRPEKWFDILSHAFKYLGPVILASILAWCAWELYHHWQTFSLSSWTILAVAIFLIGVLLLSF